MLVMFSFGYSRQLGPFTHGRTLCLNITQPRGDLNGNGCPLWHISLNVSAEAECVKYVLSASESKIVEEACTRTEAVPPHTRRPSNASNHGADIVLP